jgi:hypothetical protein
VNDQTTEGEGTMSGGEIAEPATAPDAVSTRVEPDTVEERHGLSGPRRVWLVAPVLLAVVLGGTLGSRALSAVGIGGLFERHDHSTHSHDVDDGQEVDESLLPPPVAYASVEHPCVVPGGRQTLEVVEANPGDRIRYRTAFARQSTLGDEALGGVGDGRADRRGRFRDVFAISEDAPIGNAVVGVFIEDAEGQFRGSTHAAFEVSRAGGACRDGAA